MSVICGVVCNGSRHGFQSSDTTLLGAKIEHICLLIETDVLYVTQILIQIVMLYIYIHKQPKPTGVYLHGNGWEVTA